MRKLLKYQTPFGALPAAFITAQRKQLPSLTAPLNLTSSPQTLAGMSSFAAHQQATADARYTEMFGGTKQQLSDAGINLSDYKNANQVKSAYNKATGESFSDKFGAGTKGGNIMGGVAQGVGSVMNVVGDQLYNMGGYDKNSANAGAKNVRNSMSDAAISSGVPIAMAIGAATKLIDGALDATGLRAENISKRDANKVGISGAERFINNFNNFLPGNPLALGGKQLEESHKSIDTEKLRSAYAGTLDDIDTAGTYGGRRLSFLSSLTGATDKMEKFIAEQNRRNLMITNMGRTNTLRKQSDYGEDLNRQNFHRYTGDSYQTTAIGKQGLKLLSKEELAKIYSSRVESKSEEELVSKYQNGGSILIPDGALHAYKHHMEDENPELAEELTKKGIPVVVTDENGEVEQVAEIEKEEIILEKSLTVKIEELWKEGSEKSMIEAGKLIVDTIFKNCDDNANLVNRVEV